MEIHSDVQSWLDEIDDARKREKDFRKKGKEILEIYNGEMCDKVPYNVLYSNTETLLPALYSNTPRPVVRPRYKNKTRTKLASAASSAAERMLSYLMDCNMQGYESFDEAITNAVMDGLLPGRGDISVRYDEKGTESEDYYDMDYEIAYLVSNKWDRVYYGYSTKWTEVPWKAYELFIDKDEAKRLFKGKANKLQYTEGESDEDEVENHEDTLHQGKRKTCLVYQIWDSSDNKVKYVAPSYKEGILKKVDDPLQLGGFFDSPKPIQFVRKSNDLLPTALYVLYENQAKELNRITLRLKNIVEAIKVRGIYNGQFGDALEQIMDEDDNGFVPTDEGAALLDGSLDKSIWMLPVSELMAVAQQLLQAREAVKRVIYEITGISDILRGSSMASETLGAQKIKEAWGTMRLKRLQKDVQSFVRDALRMLLEVACEKFSDESWQKMTGLPYLTEEQFNQAQMDIQRAQMMVAEANIAQQQGQPNPQVAQQAEQITTTAQLALQQPRWSEVMPILRDDFTRSFLIDIETNSTLDSEATEDQKNISEFMNAMAQFMNGAMPMVKEGVLPFDAMKSMLLAVTQRFRFGQEVEEELMKMSQPKQQDSAEAQKQLQKGMQELEKNKQNFQEQLKKAGDDLDKEFNKIEQEKQKLDFEREKFKLEQQFAEKLASMEIQMDQKDAENQIKNLIEAHKRDVQSMMDKQANNLKTMLTEAVCDVDSKIKAVEVEIESPSV